MADDHAQHDSSKSPVPGCKKCDFEIKRPLKRCFGAGSSETVVKPPDINPYQDTEQKS